jgi:hypothetical protein
MRGWIFLFAPMQSIMMLGQGLRFCSILALLCAAAGLLIVVPRVMAHESEARGWAEIVVIRGADGCPGIPGMDVRLDGALAAVVGSGEYLRVRVAPGSHTLTFYPAIPETILVEAERDASYGFLGSAYWLGWRCKFRITPIPQEEAARFTSLGMEIGLQPAR